MNFRKRRAPKIPNRIDVLSQVGDFGTWQTRRIAILWLPAIAAGILTILHRFTVLKPNNFRCLIPECEEEEVNIFLEWQSCPLIISNFQGSTHWSLYNQQEYIIILLVFLSPISIRLYMSWPQSICVKKLSGNNFLAKFLGKYLLAGVG